MEAQKAMHEIGKLVGYKIMPNIQTSLAAQELLLLCMKNCGIGYSWDLHLLALLNLPKALNNDLSLS